MATPAGNILPQNTQILGARGCGRGYVTQHPATSYILGTIDGEATGLGKGIAMQPDPPEFDDLLSTGYATGSAMSTLPLLPSFTDGFSAAASAGGEVGDIVPPTIGTETPTPDTAPGDPGGFSASFGTAKGQPIVIPVVDADSAIGFVVLSVQYGDEALWSVQPELKVWQVIYAGRPVEDGNTGFQDGYEDLSVVTGSGAPGVGCTFSLRKNDGWPARLGLSMPIAIRHQAVDGKGNVLA